MYNFHFELFKYGGEATFAAMAALCQKILREEVIEREGPVSGNLGAHLSTHLLQRAQD